MVRLLSVLQRSACVLYTRGTLECILAGIYPLTASIWFAPSPWLVQHAPGCQCTLHYRYVWWDHVILRPCQAPRAAAIHRHNSSSSQQESVQGAHPGQQGT